MGDEPDAYSKSEVSQKGTTTVYLGDVWNQERWHWWSYIQGSKGDTDVKNRLLDSGGRREGGMLWENTTDTYTWPYVSVSLTDENGVPKASALWQPRRTGLEEGGVFRMGVGRTHVYLWLTHTDVPQNPSQYCNCPPIKINPFKIKRKRKESETQSVRLLCKGHSDGKH